MDSACYGHGGGGSTSRRLERVRAPGQRCAILLGFATIEQGSTKLHEDQTRSLADAERKADDAQAILQVEQAARERADQRVAQLLRAIKDKDRLRSVGLKERHIEQSLAVEETACILAESREMKNEITGLRLNDT